MAIAPEGGRLVAELFDERQRLLVAPGGQECGEQRVAHALVVALVEPDQLAVVLDRLVALFQRFQALGEAEPRAHVGPRADDAPEAAGLLREHVGAQGPLAGGDPLFVKRTGGFGSVARLGQHDVGVGAVGGQLEGLAGELDPASPARLERSVDQVLRLVVRGRRRGRQVVDRPREPLAKRRVGLLEGLE